MPDVWSVPLNVSRTAWLYQPLASAARTGEPPVTTGGVASRLIFSSTAVAWPLVSTALHVASTPPGGVSVLWVVFSHPVRVASEGWIVQVMVTFVRYHPRQFAGAGVHS